MNKKEIQDQIMGLLERQGPLRLRDVLTQTTANSKKQTLMKREVLRMLGEGRLTVDNQYRLKIV